MVQKNETDTQFDDFTDGLKLEPHVCRSCFGRIVSKKTKDGLRHYFCTNCGLSADGHHPRVICACGIKLRKTKTDGRSSFVMVDAGIRCHENRHRTPEFPAEYVASFGGV